MLAPEQIKSGGCTRAALKILSCPSTFFNFTNTISRFGERFRDVLLFFHSWTSWRPPGAQPSGNVEEHVPPTQYPWHGAGATARKSFYPYA